MRSLSTHVSVSIVAGKNLHTELIDIVQRRGYILTSVKLEPATSKFVTVTGMRVGTVHSFRNVLLCPASWIRIYEIFQFQNVL